MADDSPRTPENLVCPSGPRKQRQSHLHDLDAQPSTEEIKLSKVVHIALEKVKLDHKVCGTCSRNASLQFFLQIRLMLSEEQKTLTQNRKIIADTLDQDSWKFS